MRLNPGVEIASSVSDGSAHSHELRPVHTIPRDSATLGSPCIQRSRGQTQQLSGVVRTKKVSVVHTAFLYGVPKYASSKNLECRVLLDDKTYCATTNAVTLSNERQSVSISFNSRGQYNYDYFETIIL
jgi:hypothetical protein